MKINIIFSCHLCYYYECSDRSRPYGRRSTGKSSGTSPGHTGPVHNSKTCLLCGSGSLLFVRKNSVTQQAVANYA